MTPFSYQRPERIDQAIALHGPDSRYIAGGTNLLDLMKENVLHPPADRHQRPAAA